MNLGQLAMLLRARHLVDVKSYTKVAGLPFGAEAAGRVPGLPHRQAPGVAADTTPRPANETTGAQA